jgi:hypothetical integral membrane protein (TIGR02206 family)
MNIVSRAVLFVLVSSVPTVLARWIATDESSERIRELLAVGMITVTLVYNVYYFSPSNFRVAESLPLQVCDLLGLVAALALSNRWRMARSILLLSAIPFVSQAVLTPVGAQQIPSLRTWLYWTFHGFIFACFLFELLVERFRPNARDLAWVFATDVCYVVLIGCLNTLFDWNYGYLGNSKPDTATLINLLGPWPFRIISMLTLAMLFQTICFFMLKGRGPNT